MISALLTLSGRIALILLACTFASLAHAADPGKSLRVTFTAAETGFDPVKTSDVYSGTIIEAIFEPLLTYDYLARPARLVPKTAEALPLVSDGGKTYTFRVKKGIYFADDQAFKGARRELTAEDYAYTIKRYLDPKNRSPYSFLFEGKIVGLDAMAAQAKKNGRFNYDAKVLGLEVRDRYTLVIRLTETDFNFSHVLAFSQIGAVAREVVDAYGDDTSSRPVGTGPYRLKRYVRSSKIVLEANPGYRGMVWDFAAGADPRDKEIVEQMRNKRLPQIGTVEISIMEETQSRWLAFERGETDLEYQLSELAPKFLTGDGRLKPEFVRRGIRLDRSVDPEIIYLHFNLQEKIGDQPNPLGGFSKEKIALRRAIAMAYRIDDQLRIIRKGQAVKAEYPIPPGIAGHDPNYKSSIRYDPATANALLDRFGYRKGADGYRSQPDGKQLTVQYWSIPIERDRQFDELIKRSLDAIGVRVEIRKERFAELIKLDKQCRLMMRNSAWIADYPDGDNFMQLLYGPNTGQSNSACYQSPEYDRLYEKSRLLPDGPARNKLYRDMTRLMEVHTAWILEDSRYRNVLIQPHVLGYKKHPVLHAEWLYIDVAKADVAKADMTKPHAAKRGN